MYGYINWLKSCVDNMHNIKVGDASSYFEALGWQLALVASIVIMIALIVVAIGIVLGLPIYLMNRAKKIYEKSETAVLTHVVQEVGRFKGIPFYYWPDIRNRLCIEAAKRAKTEARIIRISWFILLFLLMPLMASTPDDIQECIIFAICFLMFTVAIVGLMKYEDDYPVKMPLSVLMYSYHYYTIRTRRIRTKDGIQHIDSENDIKQYIERNNIFNKDLNEVNSKIAIYSYRVNKTTCDRIVIPFFKTEELRTGRDIEKLKTAIDCMGDDLVDLNYDQIDEYKNAVEQFIKKININ